MTAPGQSPAAPVASSQVAALMQGLLSVQDLHSATLYSADGQVQGSAAQPGQSPDLTLAPAALAIVGALESNLGGQWQDLVLDLDTGAVLLQPISPNNLAALAPIGLLMISFSDLAGLGRVRFAARRLHRQLQAALSPQ